MTGLPVSDHIRRLLATTVQIGSAAATTQAPSWLTISRWLHMLGFRGHFATKSRRYSVTLGRLRAERRTWRRRHDPNRWPADTDDDELDDDTTLVIVRQWTFDGAGWLTNGDAALAASAAARPGTPGPSPPSRRHRPRSGTLRKEA